MKIFVSWSGELSKKIAEILKKWIPCVLQSVEVFYSPEDIEKGENWDAKISKELSESSYGIICITSENTGAPWINFEAGAIAKTLDARVAVLMIDVRTSDIQGPLKRYQATKLEKNDIYHLISDINNSTESPLPYSTFDPVFYAVWETMNSEIESIMTENHSSIDEDDVSKKTDSSEAIEEILQLLRKQNSLLSSPSQLLPLDYLEYIQGEMQGRSLSDMQFASQILADRVEATLDRIIMMKRSNENYLIPIRDGNVFELLEVIIFEVLSHPKNGISRKRLIYLKNKFRNCMLPPVTES